MHKAIKATTLNDQTRLLSLLASEIIYGILYKCRYNAIKFHYGNTDQVRQNLAHCMALKSVRHAAHDELTYIQIFLHIGPYNRYCLPV